MMKLFLLGFFSFVSLSLPAQKFSGQWSGSFDALGDSSRTEYVLEIEANGNSFEGTSITYFIIGGKRFYTICAIKGKIDPGTKTITSTEVTKVKANTPAWFSDCFQTHVLTYYKKGDTEQLVGSWKSARKEDRCGAGSTVLSRKILVKNTVTTPTVANNNTRTNPSVQKPVVTSNKKPVTTKTNQQVVKTQPKKDSIIKKPAPTITKADNKIETQSRPETKPNIAAPKLPNGLERRDNRIFETIFIKEDEITISLYDNAEVDGDIITVLFNGEVVISKQTLSDKPITVKLKAIPGRDNTLTMYAENLGRVPPNTAIMRVQSGEDYYKVFLSADDKRNGSVVFRVK